MEEEKVLTPEVEEGVEQPEQEIEKNQITNQEVPQEEEESLADQVKIVSPGRLVAKRFFRSRLSMIGLMTLIVLFLFAFVGPIFSPWGEVEQDETPPEAKREVFNHKTYTEQIVPEVLFVDGIVGGATQPGVVYDPVTRVGYYKVGEETVYFKAGAGANKIVNRCDENGKVTSYSCVEYIWDRESFNQYAKISANHWLGTDDRGRDVFTRLMYGGRVSLTLGFVVIILETILGVILGGLAGYFGKWVDQIIMRLVDIFNCIPQLPILLILSAVLDGMKIEPKFRIYYLMGIMTFLGWAGIARVVRGQILFLREQEYMVAAEALGLSVSRKIFKHLLPNVMPQLIVQMTLGLGGLILTESTLSYLGIGIPMPYAAWGTMISAAEKPEILQNYPNLWVPAGFLIVLAVLAFNFVGDGLRDAFDPKASR